MCMWWEDTLQRIVHHYSASIIVLQTSQAGEKSISTRSYQRALLHKINQRDLVSVSVQWVDIPIDTEVVSALSIIGESEAQK